MSGELVVERDGAIACFTICRPAKRNAIGLDLIDALADARDAEASRGTAVIVLTAEPANGVFCAGFDRDVLSRMAERGADTAAAASPLHGLFDAFEGAPFSVVTAITGHAFGGGVELAMLGDVRIASPTASFTLPPAKLGIVYPETGLRRLGAALGASLLGAMLTTAEAVSANRLHAMGVLWELSESPVARARSLAETMAALPSHGRLGNRDALRAVARR